MFRWKDRDGIGFYRGLNYKRLLRINREVMINVIPNKGLEIRKAAPISKPYKARYAAHIPKNNLTIVPMNIYCERKATMSR